MKRDMIRRNEDKRREFEELEQLKEYEKQVNEKVINNLRDKFEGKTKIKEQEEKTDQERLNKAKELGDTKEMLKIKSGYYEEQRREKELSKVEERVKDRGIDEIVNEIDKIKILISKKEKEISKEQDFILEEINQIVDNKINKLNRKGLNKSGAIYQMQQGNIIEWAESQIKNINNQRHIKLLQNELKAYMDDLKGLNRVKERYLLEHKDLVEEIKKEKIKEQLKKAKLI